MFLGDLQAAGGTIKGLHRIVEEAKYNIYECFISVDDIEAPALIQEHISGATLIGFKEKETEKRVLEKVIENCDEGSKKLITKRNKWLSFSSIIKTISVCVILYYCISFIFSMELSETSLLLFRTGLGIVFGILIRQIAKVIQRMYINLLPGKL